MRPFFVRFHFGHAICPAIRGRLRPRRVGRFLPKIRESVPTYSTRNFRQSNRKLYSRPHDKRARICALLYCFFVFGCVKIPTILGRPRRVGEISPKMSEVYRRTRSEIFGEVPEIFLHPYDKREQTRSRLIHSFISGTQYALLYVVAQSSPLKV